MFPTGYTFVLAATTGAAYISLGWYKAVPDSRATPYRIGLRPKEEARRHE